MRSVTVGSVTAHQGQKVSGFINVPEGTDPGTTVPVTVVTVRPDQPVAKGTVLGRLTDYLGEPITEITAPLDGVVLYVVVSPAMTKGEPVGMVGTISQP